MRAEYSPRLITGTGSRPIQTNQSYQFEGVAFAPGRLPLTILQIYNNIPGKHEEEALFCIARSVEGLDFGKRLVMDGSEIHLVSADWVNEIRTPEGSYQDTDEGALLISHGGLTTLDLGRVSNHKEIVPLPGGACCFAYYPGLSAGARPKDLH